ncbi:hypothetical protein K4F52_002315 [Lecanicillium sp. MT-2017a]|nr:hypothetical protein K4F52_002315 [Lecanicillium sp. MT-2017a]
MPSSNDLAKALRALHVPGKPLVLPNIWDEASLRTLLSLNTPSSQTVRAVATASWAVAAARGAADEDLTFEQNLDAIRAVAPVCVAASVPLSTDLQDGYGARVAEVVSAVVSAGAHGANMEDCYLDVGHGKGIEGSLYPLDEQVSRIKTALKAAADAGCPDFALNARCDVFKLDEATGLDDETRMKEALARGKAYLEAGATTVFFWGGMRGLRTAEVKRLVDELGGKVAVLLTRKDGGHSVAELAEIGVARISVGPSLYLFAMDAVKKTAERILGGGKLVA